MELSQATVVTTQETSGFRIAVCQSIQLVGGPCGGDWLLTGTGQDESVCGTLGCAPCLLGCIPDVAFFKAFDGLAVDLPSIGKELYDAVMDRSGGQVTISPVR